MNLLDPILIVVIAFGIYTSYTDIKYGKIKNVAILLMLITGLFINIFLTKTLSAINFNVNSDFMQSLINLIVSFSFGFFLWLSSIWSQGDAKLFLGYSAILPVFIYHYGYILFFPSIVILINTFIPITIFYILNSLLHTKMKDFKANIKQIIFKKEVMNVVLYAFGLFFILEVFLNYFNIKLNFILQMIILFAFMEVLNRISPKANLIVSTMGASLRIIFSYSTIFTLNFFIQFLSTILVLLGLKFLLKLTEFYSETVKIKDLKPEMILSEGLVKTKGKIEKKELLLMTIFDIFHSFKGSFSEEVKTRLTDEDIKELQKLEKEKKLNFHEIKITKTVPFAPFLFFGVLLTYFLRGSLLYYFHF